VTHASHETADPRLDGSEAASRLERGLGRRRFVQAALATGALLAAVDFEVSQVVDRTVGVHAVIPKARFR
jgi:acetamidase/formamidase